MLSKIFTVRQPITITIFFLLTSCSAKWKMVATDGPQPRYITQMADTPNGLMLFGGKTSNSNGFDDLWEWDGKNWTLVGHGATKRWDHAYVYWPEKEQLFLFGGRCFQTVDGEKKRVDLNDNWVYRDEEWEQLNISSPEPRSLYGLVYLEETDKVVLFGGRNHDQIFDDTWFFDGEEWEKMEVSGPKKRFGHTLSYDPISGKIYLFGGNNGQELLNDFWVFDGKKWEELKSMEKPSPRMAHAMQFDDRGRALLFGGWAESRSVSDESWLWDGTAWQLLELKSQPQGRLSHALGYDSSQKAFILFGGSSGFGGEFLMETWEMKK